MPIDSQALKQELASAPYATFWASGGDAALSDMLNARNDAIRLPTDSVTGSAFVSAISASDIAAMSALQIAQLQLIASASGGVPLGSSEMQATLTTLFPALSTASKNAITALSTRPASRAEQLFGANTYTTWADIAQARRT